jgi:hypothetical protein
MVLFQHTPPLRLQPTIDAPEVTTTWIGSHMMDGFPHRCGFFKLEFWECCRCICSCKEEHRDPKYPLPSLLWWKCPAELLNSITTNMLTLMQNGSLQHMVIVLATSSSLHLWPLQLSHSSISDTGISKMLYKWTGFFTQLKSVEIQPGGCVQIKFFFIAK